MRLGAIHVPLNWRLARPELAKLLADCTPTILFTDHDDLPELPLGCRYIGFLTFCASVDAAEPGPRLEARPFILIEVDTGSVFLCDGPMFYFMGLVAQIWPSLMRGGTFIVFSKFQPEITNVRLSDAGLGVTHYFCVPQMAEALAGVSNFTLSAWSALKALFTGGAPNPLARIKWWLGRGVRMVDGYGSTEMGTCSGMPLLAELISSKAGLVGLPGPLTAVRVVDGGDQEVPVGEPGEILVSGPSVTPGYWNRLDDNMVAFTEDGWFRTGDIGRVDEGGYIFLIDRRKNMFISGGENVYPAEVEAVLAEHPGVLDVIVVGVSD
ncbi:AMP-binding enzyme [Colletotrichum lupini]|uniref:AMP-binding enzyme n=1 Tax=Colletotrichum lupini TaxID=145971 RepID=A0A9Q8SGN7_9PEZI|nr:AMP-binding enzyme [Colletotrichum lupini]UQC76157.1 AMP-binding enzyme [Colletotrichum lupini]